MASNKLRLTYNAANVYVYVCARVCIIQRIRRKPVSFPPIPTLKITFEKVSPKIRYKSPFSLSIYILNFLQQIATLISGVYRKIRRTRFYNRFEGLCLKLKFIFIKVLLLRRFPKDKNLGLFKEFQNIFKFCKDKTNI